MLARGVARGSVVADVDVVLLHEVALVLELHGAESFDQLLLRTRLNLLGRSATHVV